jgi:hypothetical protein
MLWHTAFSYLAGNILPDIRARCGTNAMDLKGVEDRILWRLRRLLRLTLDAE